MSSEQGEVTIYHHTTSEAAERIMAERRMVSSAPVDRPYAYFSTWIDGNAAGQLGYGEASVEVRVPRAITEVDEGFHTGEQYLRIRLDALQPATSRVEAWTS